MAYTEFYCQTTGSNLNSGSTTSDSASLTYASGTWVSSTGVFTVASGNPSGDGVLVGDFVSVYPDANTETAFVGQVTARTTTDITVSLTIKSGTSPVDGTTNTTLKVGGAWQGPNGASAFPFGFAAGTMIGSGTNTPRINFKGGTNYAITAAMIHSGLNGIITSQGYTTTVGDGGMAVIDGGTSGTAYILLKLSGTNMGLINLQFQNNGASGTAAGVLLSGSENFVHRCLFRDLRGSGIDVTGPNMIDSCEAYRCNQSNNSISAGFSIRTSGSQCWRSFSHHHTGTNGNGYECDGGITLAFCIAANNSGSGMNSTGDVQSSVHNCTFYNNTFDGINFTGAAGTAGDALCVSLVNNLFIKNGRYAINLSSPSAFYLNGQIRGNVFGAGTQANVSGDVRSSITGAIIANNVSLASNEDPFVSSSTGDFRITSADAKGVGYGYFMQTYTDATWTGTVSYPDAGAVQHVDSGGQHSGTF